MMGQTNPQCGCGLFWHQTCSRSPCLRAQVAQPAYTPPPLGCICPPGANKDCESPCCPRKPARCAGILGGAAA